MVKRETIAEVAREIGEEFRPRKVILFGSHARGDATEKSDVDLLVVVDEEPKRGRRSAPILRLLAEH